jgi:hypothetical protein
VQLNNILFMLLGAALVAVGVLSSALADRIRGIKLVREVQSRERASRAQSVAAAIPVVAPAELLRAAPPFAAAKPPRVPRAESKPVAATDGGEDVIAALIGAGYKKPIATEATWACTAVERATVESWTASALRRCARGALS